MDAIVYTSNTGFTQRYAFLLSQSIKLPAYSAEEAQQRLPQGARVLYMGWLMAGNVQGLKNARKRYTVEAVCAVGMGRSGTQENETRRQNALDSIPLFVLQGGFEMGKLKGLYRFMMGFMRRTVGSRLAAKTDKTEEEKEMLDMLLHGGDCVCPENLVPVLEWWKSREA